LADGNKAESTHWKVYKRHPNEEKSIFVQDSLPVDADMLLLTAIGHSEDAAD
jgi:hypothetical protein